MQWKIDPLVKPSQIGITWLKSFLEQYDLSKLEYVRMDMGRDGSEGCYGRCWYPQGRGGKFKISMQVPGPFPFRLHIRRPPIYYDSNNIPSRILLADEVKGAFTEAHNDSGVTRWNKVTSSTILTNRDMGIIWLGAHEAYHFLCKSKQIKGRNGEIEADAFADKKLLDFTETI